ncbi:Tetratricopeptide TPR_2 repeat protein [Anaeromyxobacter sp. K]|uniref:tetratricopeptide repeat protein n=1 Tax=Anaeromyxobacter sp. (strain K) TaxID=447217 RepID=UPI00015F8A99|nr:hypothetical protein [Anaeromyxobacter sp. K]ACG72709.1 Tetratricopeptide TPR_2 repeat protein [Anaeromyxobacter sp. K]
MTAQATPAAAPHGAAPARSLLEEGIAAFVARDVGAAHAAFERAHRRDPRDARAMSWYGVTLVLVERNSNLGVTLCDQALRATGPDPELLLNQARVHLALNQRERAVRAILRGLELWPRDASLCMARDTIGIRRPPVIGALSRNNPLNRFLGRIRHRWQRRHAPLYEMSPVALGFAPAQAAGTPPPAPLPLEVEVTPAAVEPPVASPAEPTPSDAAAAGPAGDGPAPSGPAAASTVSDEAPSAPAPADSGPAAQDATAPAAPEPDGPREVER